MAVKYHKLSNEPERVTVADRGLFKKTAIATTALVVAGVIASLSNTAPANSKPIPPQAANFSVQQQSGSIADLIENVKPAVVNISVTGRAAGQINYRSNQPGFPPGSQFDDFFRHHFGRGPGSGYPAPEVKAAGSGFVISADGLVVTNNHVVRNAEKVSIKLDNGKQYSAKILGTDPKTDLALLQIKSSDSFAYVSFGESDKARVGDQIVAIGNPFGLGNTATTGIISARGRDIHSGPFDDFIQIDAPINQGNSGGPLFDLNGKVVGINTAIYSPNGGNVGIGFAIPSTQAKSIVDQLRSSGHVDRGWLGVQIQPLTSELAESVDLSKAEGALIVSVVPNSPAQRAGLKVGDVITTFNGKTIVKPKDLSRVVATATPNEKYSLDIWRKGKQRHLTVVTDESPQSQQQASIAPNQADAKSGKLGLALLPLNPQTRQEFNLGNTVEHGAVIADVANGSPAHQTGLIAGDVIVRVGDTEISSPEEVVEAVTQSNTDTIDKILLLVTRGNSSRFVTLKVA